MPYQVLGSFILWFGWYGFNIILIMQVHLMKLNGMLILHGEDLTYDYDFKYDYDKEPSALIGKHDSDIDNDSDDSCFFFLCFYYVFHFVCKIDGTSCFFSQQINGFQSRTWQFRELICDKKCLDNDYLSAKTLTQFQKERRRTINFANKMKNIIIFCVISFLFIYEITCVQGEILRKLLFASLCLLLNKHENTHISGEKKILPWSLEAPCLYFILIIGLDGC